MSLQSLTTPSRTSTSYFHTRYGRVPLYLACAKPPGNMRFSTMRQRQSNRRKKKRATKKQRQQAAKPDKLSGSDNNVIAEADPKQPEASVLTQAVRAVGILPLLGLVSILLTHHLYQKHIPQWFHPVLGSVDI